ncbi:hypothetical protein V6N13_015385 [Hibiscus sabdariffa]
MKFSALILSSSRLNSATPIIRYDHIYMQLDTLDLVCLQLVWIQPSISFNNMHGFPSTNITSGFHLVLVVPNL